MMRLVSALLSFGLVACSDQRAFDAAAWTADRLTDSHPYLSERRSMVKDVQQRFPRGTLKAEILNAFGAPEAGLDCPYPDADSCAAYDLGVRPGSIDEEYLQFRFNRDRLVEAHVRQG